MYVFIKKDLLFSLRLFLLFYFFFERALLFAPFQIVAQKAPTYERGSGKLFNSPAVASLTSDGEDLYHAPLILFYNQATTYY